MRFIKYILRIFYKRGMPLNLIYFITSRCNAKCRHCFYWKRINTIKDELDLNQVKKVAKSCFGLMTLSLTGGEPFLRKDLAEITSIFSKYTKLSNIQIPTNGILTEHIFKTTEKILKLCRKDIRVIVSVSLDDFKEGHDNIRQVEGCFDKAVATIKRLKTLEDQFSNFHVGSIITMTKNNQEKVASLVDFLENELSLDKIGINIIRSEVMDMSLKKLDIRYYQEIMLRLRQDLFKDKKKLSFIDRILSSRQHYDSRLLTKIYSENKYITPCYAGSLLAIMKEDGTIYPCEMLNKKMGNLYNFDFNLKKLWFSKRAKQVRKEIKKEKCFCTYECVMIFNTLFNFRHLWRILKDSVSLNNIWK